MGIPDITICNLQSFAAENIEKIYFGSWWLLPLSEMKQLASLISYITNKLQLIKLDVYDADNNEVKIQLDAVEKMPTTTDELVISIIDSKLVEWKSNIINIIELNNVNNKITVEVDDYDYDNDNVSMDEKMKLYSDLLTRCSDKGLQLDMKGKGYEKIAEALS